MYELRLTNGNRRSASFTSNASTLKYHLHPAFVTFTATHGVRGAVLEVHHSIHGWRQVCNRDNAFHIPQFQIIDNPLVLNYQRLIYSIVQTLAECDRWPTEEESREIKAKRMARQREQIARACRRSFRVV